MTTKQTGTTARDTRPPSTLVRRPDDDARTEAERLRAAVSALERVRTQLARTQRTLDAFVAQITGTPDGSQMRSPLPAAPGPLAEPTPAPAKAPVPADPSRFDPPDVLVGHLRPPAELQPPPLPPVDRAPIGRTVPAAPVTTVVQASRPAPPGPLIDHVTRPGARPAAVDAALPAAPTVVAPVVPVPATEASSVLAPAAGDAPAAPASTAGTSGPATPGTSGLAAEPVPAQVADTASRA